MKKSIALSLLLALSFPVSQAYAEEGPSTYRISGMDRYETSANLSYEGWETSNIAVLATGSNYPDALSATPLAYKYDAPLLLTTGKSLPASIKEEITRLGVKEVYVIGGISIISAEVEKQLKGLGVSKITRISGADRYETSVKIAKKIGSSEGIVVAAGQSFADALSIAPVAAILETPILLTKKNELPNSVKDYVKTLGSENFSFVIGGEGVISKKVMSSLPDPERLSGADRYETNSEIISYFADAEILDMDYPFIATGKNFPDALSASAFAAATFNGVILTDPVSPKPTTKSTIKEYRPYVDEYIIVGGKGVLPDSTINKLIQ
ncbi:cell wall-binding repeat-containing protein [Jeotgalibacillus campisalis]|uniref:N-acetylmuramoyl-L-alanine amidase n=1 Tax=Jeotgalibacillus campisalis TaxID=220754 RepID=A0A0C2W3D9_9BACL|nr:cell wall-binding repeat-containing protein [Jeotgalibacillus campisalis]KIL51141.1 hypothetical protein KR50_10220 [Jeotgalibacillus campisalis]